MEANAKPELQVMLGEGATTHDVEMFKAWFERLASTAKIPTWFGQSRTCQLFQYEDGFIMCLPFDAKPEMLTEWGRMFKDTFPNGKIFFMSNTQLVADWNSSSSSSGSS